MNERSRVTASAPGSLMLMGEHAVLHGQRCLVTAVNKRIRVCLRPCPDDQVTIRSALGTFSARFADITPETPFTFVLTAVQQRAADIGGGCFLEIDSEFADTVGLGSSAAVTVATHAALTGGMGRELDRNILFDQALKTVRTVQGMGSGADVAGSIWGGTVVHRMEPRETERLSQVCPLVAVYSGSKTPTPEVVQHVERLRQAQPELFASLFAAMDQLVTPAIEAVRNENWPVLGRLFDINHGLMDAIGVSNGALSALVYGLRAEPGIYGAKISGSGLGDAVIGLGQAEWDSSKGDLLDVAASAEGVTLD